MPTTYGQTLTIANTIEEAYSVCEEGSFLVTEEELPDSRMDIKVGGKTSKLRHIFQGKEVLLFFLYQKDGKNYYKLSPG